MRPCSSRVSIFGKHIVCGFSPPEPKIDAGGQLEIVMGNGRQNHKFGSPKTFTFYTCGRKLRGDEKQLIDFECPYHDHTRSHYSVVVHVWGKLVKSSYSCTCAFENPYPLICIALLHDHFMSITLSGCMGIDPGNEAR